LKELNATIDRHDDDEINRILSSEEEILPSSASPSPSWTRFGAKLRHRRQLRSHGSVLCPACGCRFVLALVFVTVVVAIAQGFERQ